VIQRTIPEATPELALTPTEIYLIDQLVNDQSATAPAGNNLSLYLTKLARLGGYLARTKNPPPGNTSCGEGYRASQISNSASFSALILWVIEKVLHRPTRTDEVEMYAVLVSPEIHRLTGELAAVVHGDRRESGPIKSGEVIVRQEHLKSDATEFDREE
jgi:hypothetical protein